MVELHEEKKAGRLTTVLSYIGGAVLFFMMLLTVADVFMRYVFNSPLLGVQEITEFMMVTFVFFSLAYTHVQGAHIRVDFVMERLPPKAQKIIEQFILFIEMLLLLIISVMGIFKGLRVMEMNHISGILSIPVYPFYFVVVIGSFAMALELLKDFFKKFKNNKKDI